VSATTAQLSFVEMLDANERETQKWQTWFEHQPAELLDLPLNIALAKDVREFLLQHLRGRAAVCGAASGLGDY